MVPIVTSRFVFSAARLFLINLSDRMLYCIYEEDLCILLKEIALKERLPYDKIEKTWDKAVHIIF